MSSPDVRSSGRGDFGDEADRDEPSAYNTFNRANEWTARRVAKASGTDRDEHAYTYDAVGNLTDLAATVYRGGNTALTHRRLVYDAFGRLVRVAAVDGMDETDVALYRYNGLNMRLMWHDDADADSTLESGERFYVMFDERWRPVATFRDTDATPKESFVWHAAGGAGQSGFGGSSYIDSLILRDRDNYSGGTPNGMTSASDGTLEERRVFCQNWRADVVAVTRFDGTPIEYVRYSAYGEPTVYPIADLNMDGVVNSTDSSLWSDLLYSTSNASVYADSDLDFDGLDDWNSGGADGDLFYESYNENLGLSGVGRVSSPGVASRTGYAGYQWDQTISASHVRYRVYLPDIGRWTRRDPLGYVDGQSLYEYVESNVLTSVDESGAVSQPVVDPPLRVRPSRITPGPLWRPTVRMPGRIPVIVPALTHPWVLCSIIVGCAAYCTGSALSPVLYEPIEEPDLPRGPRVRDCESLDRAKDAACGAPPKDGRPSVPSPPRGTPPPGQVGPWGSKKWCDTLKQRIESQRYCLNARIRALWCHSAAGNTAGRTVHQERIEIERKHLERMLLDLTEHCQ